MGDSLSSLDSSRLDPTSFSHGETGGNVPDARNDPIFFTARAFPQLSPVRFASSLGRPLRSTRFAVRRHALLLTREAPALTCVRVHRPFLPISLLVCLTPLARPVPRVPTVRPIRDVSTARRARLTIRAIVLLVETTTLQNYTRQIKRER